MRQGRLFQSRSKKSRRAVFESLEGRRLLASAPPFFGPLAGWIVAPVATGNAATDTANLQNDLNIVGTAGNSNTLYIPAGNYLINQSLVFHSKSEVTIVGADPATTIIQWAGPTSNSGATSMFIDYGNTITQVNRISLNGEGQVAIGIADGYRPGAGLSLGKLGNLGNSSPNAFYGVSFTTQNVTENVNQLQLYVPANTTTTQGHTMEIIDASNGQVIPNGSLTIPAGRNGGTSGAWITNFLPGDAALAANHTYYIVAQEFNGGDSFYDDTTQLNPDYVTVASVNGSVSNASGNFAIVTPGNHSFGPVGFKVDTTGTFFPTNDQFLYDHMMNFPVAGFDVGTSGQVAETTLEGCQFSYCGTNNGNPIGSGGGVYLFGQNTIDWWIRNCQFDHDSVGIATNFGGFSMDVDNSVFSNNTLMDVYVPNGYSSAIRNSTSLDSAQFVGGGSGTGVILQSDTIIDPTSTTVAPINLMDAQLTLLNCTIRNNASYTGPDAIVLSGGDILSYGNTFGVSGGSTAYNPYRYNGTAILDAVANQIVGLNDPFVANLVPQTLPTASSNANLPIIELTPTGVANTDTANINAAISTAKMDIDNGASGAVIHLRGGLTQAGGAGTFNINSTLVIPAGYPIYLVGDGATYQGSGNSGTSLSWSGPRGGTLLDLGGATLGVAAGASSATIMNMGILGGDSAGDGIRVENADQVGGNVYSDYSLMSTDGNDTPAIYTQTGLFADGLSNTNVQLASFTADGQNAVKVIGNGAPSVGGVSVFMGAGASTIDQYVVANGGRLLVEDQYLEEDNGDTNQFASVDNSTFTLQGAEIKANVAGVDAANPPISISGTSTASILSSQSAAGIILEPDANANLLAAGDGQWSSVSGSSNQVGPFDGPLDYASQAKVALLANGNTIDQVNANTGSLSAFLQQMLAQTLNNPLTQPSSMPSRTLTDVRIYGVDIASFVNDVHLVGTGAAASLSNTPVPTTPAAPTNVIAQTSGSGGNQVSVSFTPGGEHLLASNYYIFGLGNAHNMSLLNNYTGNVGTQFTTGNVPVVITQLGRYVVPGNSQAHMLELVQASNGNVLASATLQTSGAQANAFGYVSLSTPVTLSPNTQYYLVSSETSGGDQYAANAAVYSSSVVKSIDAAGTFTGGVWTQIAPSGSSYDLDNGELDFVGQLMPRLSGEGITEGVTTAGLLPVTSNQAFQGMRFTTGPNGVTVAYLGRWIPKNTTTTQSHILELVDPANGNAVIASATLPAGQVGGVNGQFQYVALNSAVTLSADHSYYLVSQEFNTAGSDQTYAGNTQMAPSALIASSDGPVSFNGTSWTFNPDPTATSEVYHFTYGPMDLLATSDPSAVSYDIYRSSDPTGAGATLIASNINTTSFVDTNPLSGNNYYTVTGINASGASTTLGEASASPGTALPNGWSDINIDAPAVTGSAWTNNANATSFTVQGNGNTMAQWNYAYESIPTGSSFTETAYVNSLTWADGPAVGYDEFRAALMVRNGLSASGNVVEFVDVSSDFAELNGTNGSSNVTAPVWLQLRAVYNSSGHYYTFTGFYSYDDVNWSQAGINAPAVMGLPANLYVGLAVNSYATVGTTTASFSNVSVIDPSLAVPAAPTALNTQGNGNAINLSWTAPAGTNTYYDVFRSTSPGGEGSVPVATGILGGAYQDTKLAAGTTYYYTVAAVNEGGQGSQSAEASATTAGVQPGSVTGRVFNDANNNGMRDGGETGLSGVAVTLTPTGSTTGAAIVVSTASDGTYTFNNVSPGTYLISETLPSGYALTAPLGGTFAVTVAKGQAAAGSVFGDVLISSVTLNFNMLVALSQDYGKPGTFANGDLDGSGIVNFSDLVLLSQNYLGTLPPGSYKSGGGGSAKGNAAYVTSRLSANKSKVAVASSPVTIYSTRTADPLDAARDIVTFYAINNSTGVWAGTQKIIAEDATLFCTKRMPIRTYDADGSGRNDDADFAGETATPRASYLRVGGKGFYVAQTTPVSNTDLFQDNQLFRRFEVAGALLGGGVVANAPAGAKLGEAVVPHGVTVFLSGNLAAEKGPTVSFSYTAN